MASEFEKSELLRAGIALDRYPELSEQRDALLATFRSKCIENGLVCTEIFGSSFRFVTNSKEYGVSGRILTPIDGFFLIGRALGAYIDGIGYLPKYYTAKTVDEMLGKID